MNLGLVFLLEMVMIFFVVLLISFGKAFKWFFAPKRFVILQRVYWIFVIIAVIATIFGT